jgi:hypothetical protein
MALSVEGRKSMRLPHYAPCRKLCYYCNSVSITIGWCLFFRHKPQFIPFSIHVYSQSCASVNMIIYKVCIKRHGMICHREEFNYLRC